MKYKECLSYLYSKLPMYQRVGKSAYKKDLSNITQLCAHLSNPQDSFKSIHIAGTNGKGSCTHMIASCLMASGLKVGIYTSPHYKDFRERIKIGGKYISKKWVCNFVEDNKDAIARIQPSFFEITVAMAFLYFACKEVDVAIIETGLGGRLDSTNILHPHLTMITNISLDHQSMLGDSVEQIAKEKAGIIKPEIPIVIGEFQHSVADIFTDVAADLNAPLSFASNTLYAKKSKDKVKIYRSKKVKPYLKIRTNLSSPYQLKNVVSSLAAIEQWNILNADNVVTSKHIKQGFKLLETSINYIGRWQQIGSMPMTIVDSAHNVAGIQEAFNHISTLEFDHLHIVAGFVNDKDLKKVLICFPSTATYYFAKAKIPRGMEAEELKTSAAACQLIGKAYKSVSDAFSEAIAAANRNDLIFVCGSIFVVAEVI